jgi:hypothetical protein
MFAPAEKRSMPGTTALRSSSALNTRSIAWGRARAGNFTKTVWRIIALSKKRASPRKA